MQAAELIGSVAHKDALLAPLAILQQCFERQLGPPEDGFGLRQLVEQFLANPEFYQKIPIITSALARSGKLVPNCLVRYRGIVQDTFDSEYFLGVYSARNFQTGETSTRPAMYQDSFTVDTSRFEIIHDESTSAERQPLFCGPVPGDSAWTQLATAHAEPVSSVATVWADDNIRNKRGRDSEEVAVTASNDDDDDDEAPAMNMRGQRQRHDAAADENPADEEQPSMETSAHPAEEAGSANAGRHSSLLALAVGDQPYVDDLLNHGCCFVKVYGDHGLKIGEVVEFIGVYACEVELGAELNGQSDNPFDLHDLPLEEAIGRNPPTSIVPRIHAITFRRLSPMYPLIHSYVVPNETSESSPATTVHSSENAAMVGPWFAETRPNPDITALLVTPPLLAAAPSAMQSRQGVIDLLASALEADVLAAEYVLLAMLSRVTSRTDSVLVGNIAVNLTGCAPSIPSYLSGIIAELMPRTVQLDLTVDRLNQGRLYCKKDYTRNRLKPSALQLQPGTVVVVDETQLVEGRLTELGVKDLGVLGKVVQQQTLPIDFEYYHMDFPVDLPIICCSSGSRSLLSGMIQVRLAREGPLLGGEYLGDFAPLRTLLAVARTLEPVLTAEFCEMAQEEFVAARRADSSIQQQDLHLWLNLVRLVAASCGSPTVEREHWERMRTLEAGRLARLRGSVGGLNIIPEY